jgi:4-hydroxy-tetrahydrodipicolinate synthase
MVGSRDAKEWARTALDRPLIGDSLYTPFRGRDGEALDLDAYRALVRHCVGALDRRLLFVTSGNGEFWSLTVDERKRLLEATVDTARAIAPDTIIQSCTSSMTVQDALELTQHAQASGSDICFLQTPMMEAHGGAGVFRFFDYIASRTDVALGILNSPSSGYVLTPAEVARLYDEIPAVCAIKAGSLQPWHTKQTKALVPGMVVWECDTTVYPAGWLRHGLTSKVQMGTVSYLLETPAHRQVTHYWDLIWNDELSEAIDYGVSSGLDDLQGALTRYWTCAPERPDYFTHWGGAFKCAAAQLGLPVGDFPDSRPPQQAVTEAVAKSIREIYESSALADDLAKVG